MSLKKKKSIHFVYLSSTLGLHVFKCSVSTWKPEAVLSQGVFCCLNQFPSRFLEAWCCKSAHIYQFWDKAIAIKDPSSQSTLKITQPVDLRAKPAVVLVPCVNNLLWIQIILFWSRCLKWNGTDCLLVGISQHGWRLAATVTVEISRGNN